MRRIWPAGLLTLVVACLGAGGGIASTPAPTTVPATAATSSPTLPPTTPVSTTIPVPTTGPAGPLQPGPVPDRPAPDPPPPPPGGPLPPGTTGVAVIAAGGAPLSVQPRKPPFTTAHEGLVFGVEDRVEDWLLVRTGCDDTVWVPGASVAFHPRRSPGPVGAGFSFADFVVVVDPGHGGPNRGATGPTGLEEPVVNLDIARRLRDLLQSPHDVDWVTGGIVPGQAIPAANRVWLTRTEGPPGADYEAGLLFRARLAGSAGAHALVSIHNNAEPDGPFDGPGSEVFYSVKDSGSRRLAGLLVEELRRGLAGFGTRWVGDTDAGAKPRLRDDGLTDYYGLLRRAEVPSVIAEGAFISEPTEEALLATAGFRQAYAEAAYRALVRFATTDDPGSGFTEPYVRTVDAGSGNPLPTCEVPVQPGE